MTNKVITMSQKELGCLEIIQRVASKQLTQTAAAQLLGLTTRQVRNLKRRHLLHGAEGLISKRRGKPSNNGLNETLKSQAIDLLKTRYADFGPTLACEKLLEFHQLKLSKESVRQLMMQIEINTQGYTMRGARLKVCVDSNKHITLIYKGKVLPYSVYKKQKKTSKVVAAKAINRFVDSLKTDARTRGHKPPANHPWRNYPSNSPQTNQVNTSS